MEDRKDRYVWEEDNIKITPPKEEPKGDEKPSDENPPKEDEQPKDK